MDDRFEKDSTVYKPASKPEFIREEITWSNALTLKDYLFKLFDAGAYSGPEVQGLINGFGRQKIVEMYQEWKGKK